MIYKTCITLIIWVGLFWGCTHKQTQSMDNTMTAIKFNKKNTLVGIYTKSIITQKGTGTHRGHYKIVVNDTLEVILLPPYEVASIRPSAEIARFEGKKVKVIGVIDAETSLSEPTIEHEPLTVNIPCFVTIESIALDEK